MSIDVDLYRRTIGLSQLDGSTVRFSVIDAGPRDALRTLVFIHGFGECVRVSGRAGSGA